MWQKPIRVAKSYNLEKKLPLLPTQDKQDSDDTAILDLQELFSIFNQQNSKYILFYLQKMFQDPRSIHVHVSSKNISFIHIYSIKYTYITYFSCRERNPSRDQATQVYESFAEEN